MARPALGLTIYITTDTEIRGLNRKFHATNAATDVLSFPSLLGNVGATFAVAPSDGKQRPYLGDIVISYDRARAQAKYAGWDLGDELRLLVVHGLLHLMGYDDLQPRARQKMWRRQKEILGRVKE